MIARIDIPIPIHVMALIIVCNKIPYVLGTHALD